jgi:tetratricopeptide (TPR) repeat protein
MVLPRTAMRGVLRLSHDILVVVGRDPSGEGAAGQPIASDAAGSPDQSTVVPSPSHLNTPALSEDNERAEPLPPLERGALVDRYVVLELAGRGGMGNVYRAYDPQLDRAVALKLVRVGATSSSSASRERLLREAQVLARLSHPNVVAVFDAGNVGDHVYLAMEFVAGKTLRAWLQDSRRSAREILATFLAAGEGLAAAHRAGVIHRDFKPDNLIIGEDGRVRILDFGIARADAEKAAAGPAAEATQKDTRADGSVSPLSSPLTRAGAVLGTPRYMSPEQHSGTATDQRTDQFSFCMALYEALYGTLPFPAATVGELSTAARQGRFLDPPADAKVPRWIRKVLLRGLAADPDARYPSMETLLHALRQDPLSAWRRRTLVLAVLAVVGALGAQWWTTRPSQICQGAEKQLGGVWDAQARDRVRAALLGTGEPSAPQIWSAVQEGLDAYAREWTETHTESCRATRVRGEQPDSVLALKMTCLELRKRELDTLVHVLETADRELLLQHAVEAVSRLSSVRGCSDTAALTATVPPPSAEVAARVDSLRKQLAQAHALDLAGRFKDGIALATRVADEAREVHYLPVLAQSLDEQGYGLTWSGKPAEAEPLLVEAFASAYEGRDHALVAQAATHLVTTVGTWLGRPAEGHRWARLGMAALAHVGGSDDVRADLLGAHSGVYVAAEDGRAAVPLAREALQLRERISGAGNFLTAVAHLRLGAALYANKDYPAARAEDERGVELLTRLVGEHPALASGLGNLGTTYQAEKNFDKAVELTRQSLAMHEALLGANHPNVAIDLINLADVLASVDRCDEAVPHLRRAVSINDAAISKTYGWTSNALSSLGDCLRRLKRLAEARATLERAVAICEHNAQAPCEQQHFRMAQVLWDLGEHARALGMARQAVATRPNEPDPWYADAQNWIAAHADAR